MHSTNAEQTDTLRQRSLSLARRLLAGAGRASLVAYDLAPLVEAGALSHGMSAHGDLVVACLTDREIPATMWHSTPLRVRVDVVKEAPEWEVRITACAVHLLGELEWLAPDLVADYLSQAALDPQLVELATAPGGRIGIVRTDRVLVHDIAGVLPFAYDEVAERRDSFPDRDQEWAARDLLGQLPPAQLAGLAYAAASGWMSGVTLSVREEAACPHIEGHVFCVDVDRTGLTLMSVDLGRACVHFVAFDRPVDASDELADRIGQLVEASSAISPRSS
ncbi:hypothetical protein [Micropruina sp.]|uniref:hypothetical protein n=1 Tax=Micropruina sp. TaxID=2737536 RepID=UPI0039E27DFD